MLIKQNVKGLKYRLSSLLYFKKVKINIYTFFNLEDILTKLQRQLRKKTFEKAIENYGNDYAIEAQEMVKDIQEQSKKMSEDMQKQAVEMMKELSGY